MDGAGKSAFAVALQRGLSFVSVVATSVVATVIVMRLIFPAGTMAQTVVQSGTSTTVRGSEFLLVGGDGATRARLGLEGSGAVLTFFDADGQTARLKLGDTPNAQGLAVLGSDGMTNKVALGTSGSGDAPGVAVYDPAGNQRVALGISGSGGDGMWVNYSDGSTPHVQIGATGSDDAAGERILDANGNVIAQFP